MPRSMPRLAILASALTAGLLSPVTANAQVLKAQILGTITDSSGAVIQAVKVTITETRTNLQRSAETNEAGNFFFVNLDPGDYKVEAEKDGFNKSLRSGVILQPNTTARVNFELSPGAVTQTIDVSADAAPLLQTDRADTGGKIEQKQLQQMPMLYNRNYQGLLLLVPGVGRPFRPHSEFYNSHDSLSVRVNGQGRQFNNFQIEGIENKIDNGNLTALVPPAEAIQTVDMSTSNFDPEFGNAGGAVTNVTLRSGSNDFHGSLFHFHRNENIQARNTFAVTKAPTVYNQFGGTLGGRIIRDKLFFFADYQGSRDHLGQVNRGTLPGSTFRTGNLAAATGEIYDPLTGNATTGAGRTPFAGKIIPQNRISPIARRILGFVPLPNLADVEGQVNYSQNSVRIKTLDQTDSKVDWVAGANDRIAVRYSLQKANVLDPGLFGPGGIYGGFRNGGFGGSGPARTQSAGINYSKILSPTFVWESRIGAVRNRNDAINSDSGRKTAEEIGIRGANLDDWTSGLTQININGYSARSLASPPASPGPAASPASASSTTSPKPSPSTSSASASICAASATTCCKRKPSTPADASNTNPARPATPPIPAATSPTPSPLSSSIPPTSPAAISPSFSPRAANSPTTSTFRTSGRSAKSSPSTSASASNASAAAAHALPAASPTTTPPTIRSN